MEKFDLNNFKLDFSYFCERIIQDTSENSIEFIWSQPIDILEIKIKRLLLENQYVSKSLIIKELYYWQLTWPYSIKNKDLNLVPIICKNLRTYFGLFLLEFNLFLFKNCDNKFIFKLKIENRNSSIYNLEYIFIKTFPPKSSIKQNLTIDIIEFKMKYIDNFQEICSSDNPNIKILKNNWILIELNENNLSLKKKDFEIYLECKFS